MLPLSNLNSRILPHVPKASTLNVAQALEDTLIDFLDRTRAYQTELAAQDVTANNGEYTITPPSGYVLVEPYEVRLNQKQVNPTSEDELDLNWPSMSSGYPFQLFTTSGCSGDAKSWRYATATMPLFYFINAKTGKLRLVGIPDTDYLGDLGLIVSAAWKPTIGVTQVDDGIFNSYYQTLVEGALGRLMMMPQKPWTNLQLAAVHSGKYESDAAEAEEDVKRNLRRSNREVYRTVAYV